MGLLQKYITISPDEHLAIYLTKGYLHELRIYSN